MAARAAANLADRLAANHAPRQDENSPQTAPLPNGQAVFPLSGDAASRSIASPAATLAATLDLKARLRLEIAELERGTQRPSRAFPSALPPLHYPQFRYTSRRQTVAAV